MFTQVRVEWPGMIPKLEHSGQVSCSFLAPISPSPAYQTPAPFLGSHLGA